MTPQSPTAVDLDDLDELERLAKASAATFDGLPIQWWHRESLLDRLDSESAEDCAFIVAASPKTVLALIAEVRALRQAHGGWIRCSERMPTIATEGDDAGCSQWVNVYAPALGGDMAFWDGERWFWREQGYAIPSEITHWMPLPPPPRGPKCTE